MSKTRVVDTDVENDLWAAKRGGQPRRKLPTLMVLSLCNGIHIRSIGNQLLSANVHEQSKKEEEWCSLEPPTGGRNVLCDRLRFSYDRISAFFLTTIVATIEPVGS